MWSLVIERTGEPAPKPNDVENLPVEAGHAGVGAEPETAVLIFGDAAHVVVGQTLGGGVAGERVAVEAVDAPEGGDPQVPGTVDVQGLDARVDEAVGGEIPGHLAVVVEETVCPLLAAL